jgi:aldose sugar dehydrogenase
MRLSWILVAAAAALLLYLEVLPRWAAHQQPAFAGQTRAPELKSGVAFDVITVPRGLQNPWGLAFLPDGRV